MHKHRAAPHGGTSLCTRVPVHKSAQTPPVGPKNIGPPVPHTGPRQLSNPAYCWLHLAPCRKTSFFVHRAVPERIFVLGLPPHPPVPAPPRHLNGAGRCWHHPTRPGTAHPAPSRTASRGPPASPRSIPDRHSAPSAVPGRHCAASGDGPTNKLTTLVPQSAHQRSAGPVRAAREGAAPSGTSVGDPHTGPKKRIHAALVRHSAPSALPDQSGSAICDRGQNYETKILTRSAIEDKISGSKILVRSKKSDQNFRIINFWPKIAHFRRKTGQFF